jgi:ketosteroid isomerase-like protein
MERATAIAFLQDLHAAQGAFYAGGAPDRLRALLAPDIAWHVPGTSPIAGRHVGIDAVLDYMTRRRAIADATFRMHTREILVGTGDHLAALTDGTATIAGRERRWSTAGVYRLREQRLAECRLLPFDQAEFDAIWGAAA